MGRADRCRGGCCGGTGALERIRARTRARAGAGARAETLESRQLLAATVLPDELAVDLTVSSDLITWNGPVLTAFVSTSGSPVVDGYIRFYRLMGQPNDPRTATQPASAARPDDSLVGAGDGELLGTVPLVDGVASLAAGDRSGPLWYFAVYTQSKSTDALTQGHTFSNFAGAVQRYVNVVDILVLTDSNSHYSATPQELVAGASEVFWNSRTNVVLHLVGVEPVAYHSTRDLGRDLDRLLNPSDGYLDEVAALRDRYQADVVVFLAGESSNRTLGIAPVLRSLDLNVAQRSGFLVIDAGVENAQYILAHELGHVFGAAHDRSHAKVRGIFPYAYGYRTKYGGVVYRDLMSYPPGQMAPYFSNPEIRYWGVPIGNAKSDTARAIRATAPLVASFRGDAPTRATRATRAEIAIHFPQRTLRPDEPVEITATLDIPAGSPATGTVVFRDGGRVLGTAALSGNRATWKGTFASVGPHEIRATYSGNGLDAAAEGALLPSTSVATTAAIAGGAVGDSGELLVYGTEADDRISLSAARGVLSVAVNGKKQRFPLSAFAHLSVQGLAGSDRITLGKGVPGATILAGDGNDTVYGSGNADSIDGGGNQDRLYGRSGDDTLTGGKGYDLLAGEEGNDMLSGGDGMDTLQGGRGTNTFFARDGAADRLEGGSMDTASVDTELDQVKGIANLLA